MPSVTSAHLTTSNNDVDASSFNTASISPSANRLILCAVLSRASAGTTNIPTLSGNNLTWVQVVTKIASDNSNRVTIFRAMGSPIAGAVAFSFAAQTQLYCHWSITEFGNVDTSGTNGSGAIVQSASNEDDLTNTGLTVTLSAFSNANNAAFGAVRSGSPVSPGSGFIELGETSGEAMLEAEWQAAADVTVDWTWASTSSFTIGCAVEIKQSSPIIAGYFPFLARLAPLDRFRLSPVKILFPSLNRRNSFSKK